MFINYNYMFIWIYRVKRNVDLLLLVYIFTWMIQRTHYTASLYVTGVLKLFQVMEIKTHCFVGFCVKVRLLLDFYFDRSGIRVFWLILFCLSFLRSSFFYLLLSITISCILYVYFIISTQYWNICYRIPN